MVFDPVVIRQRKRGRVVPFRGGRAWVDGSLYADIPTTVIKRRYGVRHTIVSLVNPAIRPFVNDDDEPGLGGSARGLMLQAARSAAMGWASLGRVCAAPVPRVRKLFEVAHGVMRQSYTGDLVLTPSQRFFPLGKVLEQPTREMIDMLSADGEARTRGRLDDLRLLAS
jgi:predicted acylesterase/phospholipase RssA